MFAITVCYRPDATPPAPEELETIMAEVAEVRRQLQAEGCWVFGGGLHDPSTATVVTARDGTAVTTDGPFIDSKEVIGGFSIVDVADLDEALMWAERTSCATRCPIEVRPFMDDHPG